MVFDKFVYPVICRPIDIIRDNRMKRDVQGPQIIYVPRLYLTSRKKFDTSSLFSHIDKITTKILTAS